MKFGIRMPSLTKRIAARTSWKRFVRHNIGLKAPRGLGVFTNPKKAIYNRIYSITSIGIGRLFKTGKSHSSTEPGVKSPKVVSSFIINSIIFIVLTILFFPLGIAFLVYKLYMGHKMNIR